MVTPRRILAAVAVAAVLAGCGPAPRPSASPPRGQRLWFANETPASLVFELFLPGSGGTASVKLRIPPRQPGQCVAAQYTLAPGRSLEHVSYYYDRGAVKALDWEWIDVSAAGSADQHFRVRMVEQSGESVASLETQWAMPAIESGCRPYEVSVEPQP